MCPGGGGYCHTKAVGLSRHSPMEHMEREREIKKCMVTKRELLNNLSDIYKCKVSPGRTFSLGNFLFDERENYQVSLGHKERENKFFLWTEKNGQKQGHLHGTYMYTSV